MFRGQIIIQEDINISGGMAGRLEEFCIIMDTSSAHHRASSYPYHYPEQCRGVEEETITSGRLTESDAGCPSTPLMDVVTTGECCGAGTVRGVGQRKTSARTSPVAHETESEITYARHGEGQADAVREYLRAHLAQCVRLRNFRR